MKRKNRKIKKQGLPDHLLNYFLNGNIPENEHEAFEIFLMLDERKKELWKINRENILKQWIAEHPFTRPFGFWQFEDLPERRDENEPEKEFLERYDLLTNAEKLQEKNI